MGSRRESGYRSVVDHLESLIISGALAPGAKLPSLRDLCQKFQISIGTAGRGMEVLRARGLIEIRHGAGSYVRQPASAAAEDDRGGTTRIAVFIADNNLDESYCAHALRGIQNTAVQNQCAIYLNYLSVFARKPVDSLYEMTELCDGIIMLGEYDSVLAELPGSRPYVGVEMHRTFGGLVSPVSFDPSAAAEAACEFFRGQNCRKVKAVVIPHLPIHRHRALLFGDCWQRQGGELEEWIYHDPLSLDEIAGLDIDDAECGYWFSSGTICQRLAEPYRQRTGRLLAADRRVFSLDGKALLIPRFEPVNTFGANWYDIGIAAFEECIRRIRTPGTPARRIGLDGRTTTCAELLQLRAAAKRR